MQDDLARKTTSNGVEECLKRVHWNSVFEDREDLDVLNKRESYLRERSRQGERRNKVNEGVRISKCLEELKINQFP